jgi:copper(I)-binding protein
MKQNVCVLLLLLGLVGQSQAACELQLGHAWVREAPPSAEVMAGYGILENTSSEPIDVIAVSSPQFERIELHEMSMDDGMMSMRALDRVSVPAQGKTMLQGERHLMLIKPKKRLRQGVEVKLELHLSCGVSQQVKMLVATQEPVIQESPSATRKSNPEK